MHVIGRSSNTSLGHKLKVLVIGGGASGHALAADLEARGHCSFLTEVPQHLSLLDNTIRTGSVRLVGKSDLGKVRLNSVGLSLADAVPQCDLICVSVVANRHEEVAREIRPYVRAGQSILVAPDNGGSLVFAKVLDKLDCRDSLLIGGSGGNYFPCRFTDPTTVRIGLPPRPKKVAAFPATDTNALIASLDGVLDCTAGKNVLEVSLSSPNIPNHLAGALLNMGHIERSRGDFNLFRDGLSPGVIRCIQEVAEERNCVFEAAGYEQVHSDMLLKIADGSNHPELDEFRKLDGPTGMDHRYVTEDAEYGVPLLVSLGLCVGVPTPISSALLAIAGTVNGRDYLALGRTLENLGLGDLSIGQLNDLLAIGRRSQYAQFSRLGLP